MRQAREIWVGIIRQFEASGLTQGAFADERGIPVTTLRSWIYRLRREGGAEESAPILPVRVVASTPPPAGQLDEKAVVEIEVGDGVRLRFAATSPAFIAELVSLLRARC